ncbi:hypothetical protein ACWC10_05955 [Streptomyces sp. NPDC001595]|uniref:hypothetical protein n=1 Tax=Streptomyces sp. NPDC001532 TaxID=3154520 RepID=UPI00331C94A4
MARPESSTPSRTARRRRGLLAGLVCAAAALTGLTIRLLPGDPEEGYRVGTALDGDIQAGMEVTSPHTQIGKEYWVALPTADNVSDRPLTLLRGEITQVPEGLRIVGYKALSHEDTGGHPLSAAPVGGSPGIPDLTTLPDHSDRPSLIPAHEPGEVFWAARVRVTGKVTGDLTGCRYYYRQGDAEYRQELACVSRIRLGPPLKIED